MKYLSIIILIFCTNIIFSQENEDASFYGLLSRLREPIEADRLAEQSNIRTYDDLSCTYWTPIYENALPFQTGLAFIFLPNKTALLLIITREAIYNPDNEEEYLSTNTIYSIIELCTYEITNGKIIFDMGMPIMFLEESFLYVTFDGNEYQKYRLEQKIMDRTGNDYSGIDQ
jgi:hypothetical protein